MGKEQDDQAFVNLVSAPGEELQVSMSPLIRDDPDDRTVYKKFLKSGIELVFDADGCDANCARLQRIQPRRVHS